MYRRKEVVEAVRWDGSKKNADEIIRWARKQGRLDLEYVSAPTRSIIGKSPFVAYPGQWIADRYNRIVPYSAFTFENLYEEMPDG